MRSGYTFFKMALAGAPSLPMSFTGKQRDFFRKGHVTEQAFSEIMHVYAPLRSWLRIGQAGWRANVSRLAWIASQPSCRA